MSNLLYYIICGLLAVGVLVGISMMSRVESSVSGNIVSAFCTAAAIFLTLYKYHIVYDAALWICMAVGLIAGLIGAYRVKMIDMPQAVALLNGFGGAASALVAIISMLDQNEIGTFGMATAGLALAVGMITLTGSLVAGGKLHRMLPQKPVVWPGHRSITSVSLLATAFLCIAITIAKTGSALLLWLVICCTVCSAFFGVAFSIRVGGADMPITISLLNSLSGVAGSIAGMAIGDPLLVSIGGIVGASGLLLTQIMCRAMNRSLGDILTGKTSVSLSNKHGQSLASPAYGSISTDDESGIANVTEQQDPAKILSEAKDVIFVPGYGMALAQAQGLLKQLADKLERQGAQVQYAIHPVAGRMPGHMNVLLCEVDVPYESLHEMDEINPQFEKCDVALVVGANDVINPAANTAQGTPIYGMPVLNVEKAKHIIICNYDLNPGYAGVPNPLYTKPGITLLLGDAKLSLHNLLESMQQYANLH